MNYLRITKENMDKEHICCAMSGKQSVAKKEWLRQRFDDGLVFYRSAERGKCFVEYIPAENAWVPIVAEGYLYINCLWVSGSMKGHGYSNDLLEACIRDAKAQGKKGLCILCAEGRKRALFFITPISVRIPIIGCRGCNRWRRNMVFRSKLFTLLIKNLHRMYLHQSRPMLCFGTASS